MEEEMQTPTLAHVELLGAQGIPFTFRGELLGASDTSSPVHNHPTTPIVQAGQRCGACRWVDMKLYRCVNEVNKYLVYTVGRSTVPGETDRINVQWTNSGFEVVEILTTRRSGQAPKLPASSARVLSNAAQFDDDIRDAYINRAVV